MLRMYFVQQWYGLADEPVEDALYDSHALRDFCGARQHMSATSASGLLHGEVSAWVADAGYVGVTKREEVQKKL